MPLAKASLERLIEASPDIVVATDANGEVAYYNDGAAENLGGVERQIRHETLIVEHEADNGRTCCVGVHACSRAEFNHRDAAINAGLPALAGTELGE